MSRIVMSNATRRAAVAAAVATALVLTACGGGGSGNAVNEKPGVALYTNAGPAVSIASGSMAEYNIGGGAQKFVSYSASSADQKVATVAVDGTKLRISGVSAGETIVSVTDSAGASVKINVKVPADPLGKLTINAPAEITFTPGMSSQYRVTGGGGQYSVAVSNPKVVAAAVSNGVVSITAANPGSAIVMVFDAAGGSTKLDVTVTGAGQSVALYTTAPESLRLSANISSDFVVNGGNGPYLVTSSNPAAAEGTIAGNKLTVTSHAPGQAILNIRDAAGTLVVVNVVVSGELPVALYSTAPSSITLGTGSTPMFKIQGGSQPYIASTSNADVAQATIINGNELQIKGVSSGVADVFVFDRIGASFKVSATVGGGSGTGTVPLYSTAPDSITVAVSATPTYRISGGSQPYAASTSNADVAQATIVNGNELQIKGVSSGIADIVVFDRLGASFKVSAKVGGGTGAVPLHSTAPDSITVAIAATPTYRISGGAAPYTVTSSNVAVATITQTADSFTVKGVAAGNGTVSIRDANGTVVNIVVQVQ